MRRRFSFITLFVFLVLVGLAGYPTQAESNANNTIKLHSRLFTPEAGIEASLLANGRTEARGSQHVLVQLHAIPTAAQRATLAASGVELLGYIPNNAWLASVQTPVVLTRSAQSLIRWAGALQPADKLSPALRQNGVASWAREANGQVVLQLTFFKDVSASAAKQLIARYGGDVMQARSERNYVVRFPSASVVEQLATEDLVQWVENGPAPKHLRERPTTENASRRANGRVPENDVARVRTNVDALQTAHPDATGTGTRLGVWDGGVDPSHPDFTGRLWVDPDHSDPANSHGTHVAGTMAGDGRNSTSHGGTADQWRGIATEAQIFSYDNNTNNNGDDWFTSHQHGIETNNVDLSQNSWGGHFTSENCDTHNIYSQDSLDMDTIVLGTTYNKAIVSSVAASNFRQGDSDNQKEESPICNFSDEPPYLNYTSLSDVGSAKNILSVGATQKNDTDEMATFSSWGPTRDGRIKPDIVAPGNEIQSAIPGGGYGAQSGTSMATPHISGIVSLIIQRYRSVFNTDTYRPATIRAILIHTAKDLKDTYVYYTTGPDYASGYGIADALAAYEIVTTSNVFEDQIANGATQSKQMAVTSSSTPLKVTLVWDDPVPELNAQSQLVNNLDLELTAPDGSTHQPWILDPSNPRNAATTGVDSSNNVEQVYVESPATGNWTIEVVGTSIPQGPQTYSLVISSQPATTEPTPTATATAMPGETPLPTETAVPTETPMATATPTAEGDVYIYLPLLRVDD